MLFSLHYHCANLSIRKNIGFEPITGGFQCLYVAECILKSFMIKSGWSGKYYRFLNHGTSLRIKKPYRNQMGYHHLSVFPASDLIRVYSLVSVITPCGGPPVEDSSLAFYVKDC